MKKLAKILALLFAVVLIATGCKKLPEFTDGSGTGGNTPVTPTPTGTLYYQLNGNPEITTNSISISAKYGSENEITEMWLLVSMKADMQDPGTIYSGIEMNYPELSGTVTDLEPSTQYFWCISYIENDNSYKTDPVEFTTLESGGGGGDVPTGAINGLFSVSDTKQVYFSKGNLQYKASTNTWKFADKQYYCAGQGNANISPTNTNLIDLFGWGTSGYNHGAICYQPYSTSETVSDYYAYGSVSYNLNDETGLADWGYNAISNGGNIENLWRTLTKEEWEYVFTKRIGTSFAKAIIDGKYGVLIFPDNWDNSIYNPNDANNPETNYESNNISSSLLNDNLEPNGVVFLPTGYIRYGITVTGFNVGHYWSTTNYDNNSYCLFFSESTLNPCSFSTRSYGCSVRLVHDVN